MYDRTQILSAEEEKYKTTRRESAAIALRLKPQNEYEIPEYYPAFLEMLKSLLDGNMDATTYEDKLRDMYGIHAYIAFTLDRVSSYDCHQPRGIKLKLYYIVSGRFQRRSSTSILRYWAQRSRVLWTVPAGESKPCNRRSLCFGFEEGRCRACLSAKSRGKPAGGNVL